MVIWQRRTACKEAEVEDSDEENFKAFYIIIFSNAAKRETISHILDLITRSQHDGGAELLVRKTTTESEVRVCFMMSYFQ